MNSFTRILNKFLIFTEPSNHDGFVLDETENNDETEKNVESKKNDESENNLPAINNEMSSAFTQERPGRSLATSGGKRRIKHKNTIHIKRKDRNAGTDNIEKPEKSALTVDPRTTGYPKATGDTRTTGEVGVIENAGATETPRVTVDPRAKGYTKATGYPRATGAPRATGTAKAKGDSRATGSSKRSGSSRSTTNANDLKTYKISGRLTENLGNIKAIFNCKINSDFIIREFEITIRGSVVKAFLIFFDGVVDRNAVNETILLPLMMYSGFNTKGNANDEKGDANDAKGDSNDAKGDSNDAKGDSNNAKGDSNYIKEEANDTTGFIKNRILPYHQLITANDMETLVSEVLFGGCGILADGMTSAFIADVKGWEHRKVERPNTELVIRGPQEGFNEVLRVNTGLIRKRLLDHNLIVESLKVGNRGKTPVSVLYIKDITNQTLVNEVLFRLKNLEVDYVNDSGELEQLIEENSFFPIPHVSATERPDKVATALTEGRVAVIMHGSPFALVLPTNINEFLKSSEDSYIRFPYVNLLKFIRFLALFFSLFLPGIYIAITTFHSEMIPTDLLLAIEATREKIPFPAVVEILIMEISFELIREAGIRIPGPIGPTLGIIGALILGQAAVAANIVSPILIIIVAVTGISSFALPNFSFSYFTRVTRFFFIILAAVSGFLGITGGVFFLAMWIINSKSFGVPFIVPLAPRTKDSVLGSFFRKPLWKEEKRRDYLQTQKTLKQEEISRKWMFLKRNGSK